MVVAQSASSLRPPSSGANGRANGPVTSSSSSVMVCWMSEPLILRIEDAGSGLPRPFLL